MEKAVQAAAEIITQADALLIGAGAGMGVDSGLPDFRGRQGFWRAYPVYAKLNLNFEDMANPRWFETDPYMAWGFYGHRLNLYRQTVPHQGFQILRRWAASKKQGGFVFTSNVDGQFQKAGFEQTQIYEMHGSIYWLQCTHNNQRTCTQGIFETAPELEIKIELATMRASEPLPTCPTCGSLARPNILMFGDGEWDATQAEQQHQRLNKWLTQVSRQSLKLAVIECGAGTVIPGVRRFAETLTNTGSLAASLIRINLREAQVSNGSNQIGIAEGALAALQAIDSFISK